MNIDLSSKDLIYYLDRNNSIDIGLYGIISVYNDDTLIKIYYKNLFNTYSNLKESTLNNEIDNKINKNDLERKINALNNSNIDLIKGYVTYKDCIVGVLLTYYKDYVSLDTINDILNNEEKIIILYKLKSILLKLHKNGIYPRDFTEKNILVNLENLNIKVIDLDDEYTIYSNKQNKRLYKNIYNEIKTRLSKN